jgi:hypothetical protein
MRYVKKLTGTNITCMEEICRNKKNNNIMATCLGKFHRHGQQKNITPIVQVHLDTCVGLSIWKHNLSTLTPVKWKRTVDVQCPPLFRLFLL